MDQDYLSEYIVLRWQGYLQPRRHQKKHLDQKHTECCELFLLKSQMHPDCDTSLAQIHHQFQRCGLLPLILKLYQGAGRLALPYSNFQGMKNAMLGQFGILECQDFLLHVHLH